MAIVKGKDDPVKCPACGQEIPDRDIFCRNCGTKVREGEAREPRSKRDIFSVVVEQKAYSITSEELNRPVTRCPYCEETFHQDEKHKVASFCPICGRETIEVPPPVVMF